MIDDGFVLFFVVVVRFKTLKADRDNDREKKNTQKSNMNLKWKMEMDLYNVSISAYIFVIILLWTLNNKLNETLRCNQSYMILILHI